MKLGDTVLYTTKEGGVWVATIARINFDGTVGLFCLNFLERKEEWLENVSVTGELVGTEGARGRWSPR